MILLDALIVLLGSAFQAEGPPTPYTPRVAAASGEAEAAIPAIQTPKNCVVRLFAAEPMLANPVAMALDEQGRVYVVETFRHSSGTTDNRSHMNWLDDDLASKSVADRVAMYRKYLDGSFADFAREHDRLKLVVDLDGDGKADRSTVFADGFNKHEDGLAAGVLARGGNVWFTCVPNLWKLQDTNNDGKADRREVLSSGYGVHVAFIGHDLHGLRFGPDGKLYFSIGDRGLRVETPRGVVDCPDTGAVLRCNPDGSDLELFATGLRNPQELAFDEFGNLFTGDNNSDSGDKARWVYVMEGSDSGWRIGYQYMEGSYSRGPWNAEKLWYPPFPGQAAYITPPIANLGDGPSGLTYEPGMSALPDRYRKHFFLCDFRGARGQSGIRSFTVKPRGAGFELADDERFVWSLLATDADFGPDGSLSVVDWVDGWEKPGKGRVYRILEPGKDQDPCVKEVRSLLSGDWRSRTLDQLAELLAHADMRVRQEAQFTLASRGASARATFQRVAANPQADRLARLHAVWGLGQLGAVEPVAALLHDADSEVRAQAARVVGDGRHRPALPRLVQLLNDPAPRVRSFAALALGKLGKPETISPLLALLKDNADRDPWLRHAGVMGLAGSTVDDGGSLIASLTKASTTSERMGVLLTLRRKQSPLVARFLDDPDASLVLEAARAVYDVPIPSALPALAALSERDSISDEALARRVLQAAFRLGRPQDAQTLARWAERKETPEVLRRLALSLLGQWPRPSGRDGVVGLWRPIAPRPAQPAADALASVFEAVSANASEETQAEAAIAAGKLGVKSAGPLLLRLVDDAAKTVPNRARIEALRALEVLESPQLNAAVQRGLADASPRVRSEARRLQAKLAPAEAVKLLAEAAASGSILERQQALANLGGLPGPDVDQVLSDWLDRLMQGQGQGQGGVPSEIRLDVLEAVGKRTSPELKAKLAAFEASRPRDDALADYRECLTGGDVARGRKLFADNPAIYCVRCHKVDGVGGEVGPALDEVAAKRDREYLLRSIVRPNDAIAEGFETMIVATVDGQVLTGVLKADEPEQLRLVSVENKPFVIRKDQIEERKRGDSAMPTDLLKHMSKSDVRDLVEWLSTLKGSAHGPSSKPAPTVEGGPRR